MEVKVLALDLEGTLISNAMSQFPRPGLRPFLEWCFRTFPRVVLFTGVEQEHAHGVLMSLSAHGDAPPAVEHMDVILWHGDHKDLNFISGATPGECRLVDDLEHYIKPSQREQWIPIKSWMSPYSTDDRELQRVESILRKLT